MKAPTKTERAAVAKPGKPRVVQRPIFTCEDGTEERGFFAVIVYVRTDRQGRKDLRHFVKRHGCRALPACQWTDGNPVTLDNLLTERTRIAATEALPAIEHAEAFPDAWILYGTPDGLFACLLDLDGSYARPGRASTLVRWEYLTTTRVGTTAAGAGGGEGWRPQRPPLPLAPYQEAVRAGNQDHSDDGTSLSKERAQTGRGYVPGPKRGYHN